MLQDNTHAVLAPDVLCTDLPNGETVLLHMGTQTYYSLNVTGARIWHLMSEGRSLGDIAQAIEATYEISGEGARQHVRELVSELAAEKLLTLSTDNPCPQP